LLAEDGVPVRMRGYYLGDDQLAAIASRAAALRAGKWLAAGDRAEVDT
jgi:hypothetical protein